MAVGATFQRFSRTANSFCALFLSAPCVHLSSYCLVLFSLHLAIFARFSIHIFPSSSFSRPSSRTPSPSAGFSGIFYTSPGWFTNPKTEYTNTYPLPQSEYRRPYLHPSPQTLTTDSPIAEAPTSPTHYSTTGGRYLVVPYAPPIRSSRCPST